MPRWGFPNCKYGLLLLIVVMIVFWCGNFPYVNRLPILNKSIENQKPQLLLFTPEEMQFFATGKGNAPKHERRLEQYIRSLIGNPSGMKPVLNKTMAGNDYSQREQSPAVDELLGKRRKGFYVECGAHDGEFISNTLFFELERNWTGLLIEPNLKSYAELISKNRNAYSLPSCLSVTDRPTVVEFSVNESWGGIVSQLEPYVKVEKKNVETIQCYPFNAIMDALGVTHVDYFSLDVERSEIGVLNSIDWKRFQIDVLTLEYAAATPELTHRRFGEYETFFNETALKHERVYEMAFHLPKRQTRVAGLDVVYKLKI